MYEATVCRAGNSAEIPGGGEDEGRTQALGATRWQAAREAIRSEAALKARRRKGAKRNLREAGHAHAPLVAVSADMAARFLEADGTLAPLDVQAGYPADALGQSRQVVADESTEGWRKEAGAFRRQRPPDSQDGPL